MSLTYIFEECTRNPVQALEHLILVLGIVVVQDCFLVFGCGCVVDMMDQLTSGCPSEDF